ncbi:MAG: PrsW family intramembrane metalloprotease [Clostridia bacterium]|nr:PrsW family intramembrane metalloprotease [Clostridia bacterium]
MNYIENIYVCLAAPLILAVLYLRGSSRRALIFLLAGMTTCLLSAYISAFATGALGVDFAAASYEIAPVVEECMKLLPILFYLIVFTPGPKEAISGVLMTAAGFATFENVCFLTDYGTSNLLRMVIRGFGTGAMHVACGVVVAAGLLLLWDMILPRAFGTFALLCFVITFHAVFNIFVSQTGPVFWIGSSIPMTLLLGYLLFIRKRIRLF